MFINIVCVCAVVVCVFGAPSTDVVPLERRQPTVIPIVEQSEEIEANGTFKFSYETGNGIKREEVSYDKVLPKTKSGIDDDDEDDNNEIHVQQGSYSYTAPDGTVITVRYIADENGFRPIGDHLPKPPSILIAASSSRVSGRRSKTADSDAGGSALISTFAAAPVVVPDIPLAPASSQASNAPESLKLQSRIADTSAVKASAPESALAATQATGAQESSTTSEVPSTTEVPSTKPSASTTESVSTTTEPVSTSEVTSTELPTTSAAASTSEASSESSTTEEAASTPAVSTPETTPSLNAVTEAAAITLA